MLLILSFIKGLKQATLGLYSSELTVIFMSELMYKYTNSFPLFAFDA